MDDIDYVVLSDISEINPPTDRHGLDDNTMVSFIPMADVSESGEWINQQARPFKDVRNGYTCFQEDDILFAKITPCMENGKGAHAANLLNGIGFGTTEFHILRAKSRVHPRFIYHWIMNEKLRRKAEARMTGSAGQRRVPASFFDQFKVPFLPLPEQRYIAEILDTIDEAIQKTDALISKLKAMKQGLLHDLLTCGLDENGKRRDPKAHPKQFKDSPTGRIPKEWHTIKLAKLVIRAEYGISVSLEDDSGIPVLRMNNLVAGEVDLSELKYSKSREASNLLLNPRDVLFNRTNSMDHVGRTAIWRGQLKRISFASYLVRIVPDYSKLIPEYLNMWLNSQSTQVLIRKYATPGVHQVNINPTNLQKVDIALPQSVGEQRAIVDSVEAHNTRIRTEEQYRDKLKLQKKGLMHDLLTGKVRVKV